MTVTKVSTDPLLIFSHPLCGWPFDFCGGGGCGLFSLGKNFFPKPLGLEFFSLTYKGVRFFSALYTSWAIYFSLHDIIFPRYILASFSSPRNQSAWYLFLKSPITPSKVKWSAPKIHQTLVSWQILICQLIWLKYILIITVVGKKAKVIFSYYARREDELTLKVGDIVDILGTWEDGWWNGQLGNKEGYFPSNYVEMIANEDVAQTNSSAVETKYSQSGWWLSWVNIINYLYIQTELYSSRNDPDPEMIPQ